MGLKGLMAAYIEQFLIKCPRFFRYLHGNHAFFSIGCMDILGLYRDICVKQLGNGPPPCWLNCCPKSLLNLCI